MSMKSSNDTIGNRTRDLPQCLKQLRHCVPSPPHPLLFSCLSAIFTFQLVKAGVKLLMQLETPKIKHFAAYVVKTDSIWLISVWELNSINTASCFSVQVINTNFAGYRIMTAYTRAVHKETELFLFYCFTYNLIKLVSFRVSPSTLDKPRPTFFPVLERILERVLRDGAKVPYRIFFYPLYRLKSATF